MKIRIKTNFSRIRAEQFFKFHLLKRTSAAYLYYLLSFCFLVISIIDLIWFKELFVFLCALIVAIIIPLLRPMQVKKVIKKIMKDNSLFGLEYTVVVTDKELLYITNDVTKNYSWDKLICVCEVNNSLYFYITKDVAIIIPLYAVKEQDRQTMIDFLKINVKYRKYKFKQKVEEE